MTPIVIEHCFPVKRIFNFHPLQAPAPIGIAGAILYAVHVHKAERGEGVRT